MIGLHKMIMGFHVIKDYTMLGINTITLSLSGKHTTTAYDALMKQEKNPMTRIEQLEAALGILLEQLLPDMPKNPRLMPEWFLACAAVEAKQTDANTDEILKRAHAAAISRMRGNG